MNKSRLKWAVTSHMLLFGLMCAKLLPEVLDRLDVFVLELEELFIPKVTGTILHVNGSSCSI